MTKSKEEKQEDQEAKKIREEKIVEDKKYLSEIKDPKERKEVEKFMNEKGISAKLAIYIRMVQANEPEAKKLYDEFIEKFNLLGFKIVPKLKGTPSAITAVIETEALTHPEHENMSQFYKSKKEENGNSKDSKKA